MSKVPQLLLFIIYKMMPILEQEFRKYNHLETIRGFPYNPVTVNRF